MKFNLNQVIERAKNLVKDENTNPINNQCVRYDIAKSILSDAFEGLGNENCFLFGGFIRDVIAGLPFGDIDIFCESKEKALKVIENLKAKHNVSILISNKNCYRDGLSHDYISIENDNGTTVNVDLIYNNGTLKELITNPETEDQLDIANNSLYYKNGELHKLLPQVKESINDIIAACHQLYVIPYNATRTRIKHFLGKGYNLSKLKESEIRESFRYTENGKVKVRCAKDQNGNYHNSFGIVLTEELLNEDETNLKPFVGNHSRNPYSKSGFCESYYINGYPLDKDVFDKRRAILDRFNFNLNSKLKLIIPCPFCDDFDKNKYYTLNRQTDKYHNMIFINGRCYRPSIINKNGVLKFYIDKYNMKEISKDQFIDLFGNLHWDGFSKYIRYNEDSFYTDISVKKYLNLKDIYKNELEMLYNDMELLDGNDFAKKAYTTSGLTGCFKITKEFHYHESYGDLLNYTLPCGVYYLIDGKSVGLEDFLKHLKNENSTKEQLTNTIDSNELSFDNNKDDIKNQGIKSLHQPYYFNGREFPIKETQENTSNTHIEQDKSHLQKNNSGSKALNTIKRDISNGVIRFATKKINQTFRDGIVKFISTYMDNDASIQFARFLDTEIGEALLSYGMAWLIRSVPIENIKSSVYFQEFANEFATNGCSLFFEVGYEHGAMLFDSLVKPMIANALLIPEISKDPNIKTILENVKDENIKDNIMNYVLNQNEEVDIVNSINVAS